MYPLTFYFVEEEERFISDSLKSEIQFWVVILLFVMSTFSKYWREEVCLNFTQDSVLKKCKQLETRLNQSRASDLPLNSDDDTPQPKRPQGNSSKEHLNEKQWMEDQQ